MTLSELIQKLKEIEKDCDNNIIVEHAFKWDIDIGFETKSIVFVGYNKDTDTIILM